MFSKSCQYALRAVLYLGSQATSNHKLGVQQIAESIDIPKHYLAKILQRLTKHKLISSVKGPKGGFYLTEKNLEQHLIKVVECMDGLSSLEGCLMGLGQCSGENPCLIHHESVKYREKIMESFSNRSIKDAVNDLELNNFTI